MNKEENENGRERVVWLCLIRAGMFSAPAMLPHVSEACAVTNLIYYYANCRQSRFKKPPKYREVFIAIKLHENRHVSELRMKSGVMIQCKF